MNTPSTEDKISILYSIILKMAGEMTCTQALTLALLESAQDRPLVAERFEAHMEDGRNLLLFSEAHEQAMESLDLAAEAIRKVLK